MFSRSLWRPLAGAVLLAVPALTLVPGCGGGSSNSNGGRVTLYTGVELLDGSAVVTRGNISVTFDESKFTTQNVIGYLLILGSNNTTPTAANTTSPTPTATTVLLAARQTRALPLGYVPASATYQFSGTTTLASSTANPVINVQGAFEPERPFTIVGPVYVTENTPGPYPVQLTSTLVRPNRPTQSGTLQMRVLAEPFPIGGTTTSTPVTTGTPVTTNTPVTTGTPTATITATPTTTPTPTVTPIVAFP